MMELESISCLRLHPRLPDDEGFFVLNDLRIVCRFDKRIGCIGSNMPVEDDLSYLPYHIEVCGSCHWWKPAYAWQAKRNKHLCVTVRGSMETLMWPECPARSRTREIGLRRVMEVPHKHGDLQPRHIWHADGYYQCSANHFPVGMLYAWTKAGQMEWVTACSTVQVRPRGPCCVSDQYERLE